MKFIATKKTQGQHDPVLFALCDNPILNNLSESDFGSAKSLKAKNCMALLSTKKVRGEDSILVYPINDNENYIDACIRIDDRIRISTNSARPYTRDLILFKSQNEVFYAELKEMPNFLSKVSSLLANSKK